jgi:uncharacterized membrane protein
MNYYFPPLLIILGLVMYQISQKSADENANPFILVIISYLIGIVACIGGYFLFPRQEDAALLPMLKSIGWTAVGIGIGATLIEVGFFLAYRAGWSVGILPLSVTAFSTILLVIIGIFVFRESLSIEKVIGVLLCLGGLILITLKK